MSQPEPAPAPVKHRWLKLAASLAVTALGYALFYPRVRLLRAVPLLMVVGGLLWAISLLFLSGVPADAPRRRRFKSVAATLISLLIVLLASSMIVPGPSLELAAQKARHAVGLRFNYDNHELGWGPTGKGIVGERGDVVDPGKGHIVLMGDSVMFGHGLPEGDKHVGQRLGALMPHWQVLNGAVSGYSIDQYYLYLRQIVDDVKPKAIVVGVFSGNDYQGTARELTWGVPKPLFVVQGGELVRADDGARCIHDLSSSLLFRTLWRSEASAMAVLKRFCAPRELRRSEAEAVIARLFVAIDELGQRHGMKPLFLLLPGQHSYNLNDRESFLYTSKYRDLRTVLQRGGHDFYEPALAVARAVNQSKEPIYMPDNAHLAAKGHEFLAEEILAQLEKRGISP